MFIYVCILRNYLCSITFFVYIQNNNNKRKKQNNCEYKSVIGARTQSILSG